MHTTRDKPQGTKTSLVRPFSSQPDKKRPLSAEQVRTQDTLVSYHSLDKASKKARSISTRFFLPLLKPPRRPITASATTAAPVPRRPIAVLRRRRRRRLVPRRAPAPALVPPPPMLLVPPHLFGGHAALLVAGADAAAAPPAPRAPSWLVGRRRRGLGGAPAVAGHLVVRVWHGVVFEGATASLVVVVIIVVIILLVGRQRRRGCIAPGGALRGTVTLHET